MVSTPDLALDSIVIGSSLMSTAKRISLRMATASTISGEKEAEMVYTEDPMTNPLWFRATIPIPNHLTVLPQGSKCPNTLYFYTYHLHHWYFRERSKAREVFMETEQEIFKSEQKNHENSKAIKVVLVILNFILMSIGQVGGPILSRLYFLHGGNRRWFSSWLLTAGFPILIIPIAFSYARARSSTAAGTRRLLVTPWLFMASAFLGFLLGVDSYLYSFGSSYLPISVSSLLGSTQLAFTAIFAFVVVKQKFTHYSINSVVLMTFGSIILGFNMDGDRPRGESNGKYVLGFFMTISAAALHGFIMPAVEYTNLKAGKAVTYDLVMQVQFLISMFATLFCTVPMIINGDFQAISREAGDYELGATKYYTIVVLSAIALQFLIIGSLGVIFCSTSLLGGLVSSLLVPLQQVFGVIFLHERFSGEKAMALAMCLWGFASYLYGEYKRNYKKPAAQNESRSEAV